MTISYPVTFGSYQNTKRRHLYKMTVHGFASHLLLTFWIIHLSQIQVNDCGIVAQWLKEKESYETRLGISSRAPVSLAFGTKDKHRGGLQGSCDTGVFGVLSMVPCAAQIAGEENSMEVQPRMGNGVQTVRLETACYFTYSRPTTEVSCLRVIHNPWPIV